MHDLFRTAARGLMVPFAAALLFNVTFVNTDANAKNRVTIGVTETMETHNPYGDSVALLYGIYTEITGPMCKYNWKSGEWEGRLAKSWAA